MVWVVDAIATGGVMDGWVVGWMDAEVLITTVVIVQEWNGEIDAKKVVIKIMRKEERWGRQDDGERLKLANNRLYQRWQITDLLV
jgi:hypothetical protein